MKRTYSHLDLNDRRRIARWRHAGVSIDIIAEKLGRHRSTIFRVNGGVISGLPAVSGRRHSGQLLLRVAGNYSAVDIFGTPPAFDAVMASTEELEHFLNSDMVASVRST